jgi:hypothetical protein
MKLCLDSDDLGPHGAQEFISKWHVQCDNAISFSPTTPSTVVLPSSTYNSEACIEAESACNIETLLASGCAMSHPISAQPEQFASCWCQPKMLSAASVCDYDNNKTCYGIPAALSNIPQWSFCSVGCLFSIIFAQC